MSRQFDQQLRQSRPSHIWLRQSDPISWPRWAQKKLSATLEYGHWRDLYRGSNLRLVSVHQQAEANDVLGRMTWW